MPFRPLRHTAIQRTLAVLILALAATASHAQSEEPYPSRPIRMIVPYAPGGSSDNVARIVAERLAPLLGQPVIVDNRGGAAGTIGAELAQRSKPDGYTPSRRRRRCSQSRPTCARCRTTRLTGSSPWRWSPSRSGSSRCARTLPVRTLPEFITLAKKQPGKLSFGSAGPGSITQLYGELLKQGSGIDILHVPFKGSADSLERAARRPDRPDHRPGRGAAIPGRRRSRRSRSRATGGSPSCPTCPPRRRAASTSICRAGSGCSHRKERHSRSSRRSPARWPRRCASRKPSREMMRLGLFAAYENPAAFAKQLRKDDQLFAELIRKAGIKE